MIDKGLPGRPRFQSHDLKIGSETVTMYSRDILQCIRALYGNPEFAAQLIHKPERHYKRFGDQKTRIFHDMHTGSWWWEIQVSFSPSINCKANRIYQTILEARKPGASVIPVIVATDQTQLTVFGNKTAHPLYMSIGNIPKDIRSKPSRRGQVLLTYLPTSKLSSITNKAARRRMVTNLFHACLQQVLAPLIDVGIEGMPMSDGIGTKRRVHPILAVYIGDYPEQVLVTGTKTRHCPKCDVLPTELGDLAPSNLRDVNAVLNAHAKLAGNLRDFKEACKAVRIKPIIHPFWEQLPFVNIFQAITPDILHQLHQGILKHLISWLIQAYGATEIDARFRRLIPNHHIRVFARGISSLSRVTGKEHALMGSVILGVIADMGLLLELNATRLLHALRALLDFMYLAQLPTITIHHLALMKTALGTFHDNKQIFIDLGIREQFNLPKLHACTHYIASIKLFGTTDNYDTQYTERLHIDLAKEARRATNMKDELPQMTTWLERREKVARHEKYINWRHEGTTNQRTHSRNPQLMTHRFIKMAKHPTVLSVPVDQLESKYGAAFFRDAFARFVILWRNPQTTRARLEQDILDVHIPFINVSVYHRIRFRDKFSNETTVDAIHAQPPRKDKKGRTIPGRFDTGLVHPGEGRTGIHGACAVLAYFNEHYSCSLLLAYRVAQIRTIFSINSKAVQHLFGPSNHPPQHLAYVEWFTPFQANPEPKTGLYKISRTIQDNARIASIVPVTNITQSIHLAPLPGRNIPLEWTSTSVIEQCQNFLVNSFMDKQTYLLFHGPT